MGILDKLLNPTISESGSFISNGSIYAPNYFAFFSLPKSQLATPQSKLHAVDVGGGNAVPGYSTGEDDTINKEVFTQAQRYDDGHEFALPDKGNLFYHIPQSTTYLSPSGDQVTVKYTSENTYLKTFTP
jgi:hypothetical protein